MTSRNKLPYGHRYALLCGSRDIPVAQFPRIQEIIRYYVTQLWRRNWTLLVGDAYGVDAQALRIAQDFARRHTFRYQVYGVTARPRNGAPFGHYTRLVSQDYAGRDRYMVDQAYQVICISNGQLFRRGNVCTGTYAAFRYALSQGKRVIWWSEVTGFGYPVVIGEPPPGRAQESVKQLSLW